MQYDFDSVPDRRASDSLKWHHYDAAVLPMWVADMDFVSPEPVVRALRHRADHGFFGYPEGITADARQLPAFRQLIVDRMAQRYYWQVQPQDLVFVPGW